jgi:DNA-binding LacI/PurR family transcriptional regulator
MAELGLPPPLVVPGELRLPQRRNRPEAIIARHGGMPDAIICGSDVMAIGCLDCARHELGIDVPGQLSVAGFDAVEPSNWLSYNLTTLRQPMAKMAAAAAQLLCARMNSHDVSRRKARVQRPVHRGRHGPPAGATAPGALPACRCRSL